MHTHHHRFRMSMLREYLKNQIKKKKMSLNRYLFKKKNEKYHNKIPVF